MKIPAPVSSHTLSVTLLSLLLMTGLSACNPADGQVESSADRSSAEPRQAARPAAPPACNNCGHITSIETLKVKGEGSGFGAVAGAVAGAVIGHQVGGGRGKDVATVAGAVGGGFAGNEIEKRAKGTTYYRVTVNMESGGMRTLDVAALNGLSTGTKVKVVGNNLQVAGN